jgi:L-asparaginase II
MSYSYFPLYEITRGMVVESIHFGAIAVVDSHGGLVASYGDPLACTYLRSSAKPFQALPFIEHGGQKAYNLSAKEISLMCASHSGTDDHVAAVRALQAKIGLQESDLLCGVHPPFHKPTAQSMLQRGEQPTPNRHNCSGKHTGMLAYARMKHLAVPQTSEGIPYIDPSHPVQKDILQAFAEMCALPVQRVYVGTDGCSVPTFAVPLYNSALAFACLCDPEEGHVVSPGRAEACRTIAAAMTSEPDMVGGPDSFDTRLMRVARGRVLCKSGAEGYLAMGLMPGALAPGSPAMGVAIKISDGDLGAHARPSGDPLNQARPAAALEVLRQMHVLSPDELEALADFGPSFTIHNWRKLVVGEGRPAFQLAHGRDI